MIDNRKCVVLILFRFNGMTKQQHTMNTLFECKSPLLLAKELQYKLDLALTEQRPYNHTLVIMQTIL